MPNRYLKEGLLTSEALDTLTAEEERMFTRLLLAVDDFGRFDGRAVIVRSRCFPLKDALPLAAVESWLRGLARSGVIRLYQHDGKPYIAIAKWTDKPRSSASKFPAPPAAADDPRASASNCAQMLTGREQLSATREQLSANAPVFGIGIGSGSEVDHEKVLAAAAASGLPSDDELRPAEPPAATTAAPSPETASQAPIALSSASVSVPIAGIATTGKRGPRRSQPKADAPIDPAAAAEREAERRDADTYLATYQRLCPAAGVTKWPPPDGKHNAFMAFRQARKARPITDLLRALEANVKRGGEAARLSLAASLSESWIQSGLLAASDGGGRARPPDPDANRPRPPTAPPAPLPVKTEAAVIAMREASKGLFGRTPEPAASDLVRKISEATR